MTRPLLLAAVALRSPDHLQGKVACRATGRDGTFLPVTGRWEARRAPP